MELLAQDHHPRAMDSRVGILLEELICQEEEELDQCPELAGFLVQDQCREELLELTSQRRMN